MHAIQDPAASTDMTKQGRKYGNLPNMDSSEKRLGYFFAGCARKPPIAGPITRAIARDDVT